MKRLLFIAKFEYVRQITRRGFLFVLFGMPLLMVATVVLMALVMVLFLALNANEQAIGFVDQAGVIRSDVKIPSSSSNSLISWIPMYRYSDEEAAHQAYTDGTIDIYVIIPPDYLDRGVVITYGQKRLSYDGQFTLRWVLRKSMLADEPDDVARVAYFPVQELKHRLPPDSAATADSAGGDENQTQESDTQDDTIQQGDAREEQWYFPLALIFGTMFVGTIMSSSSYLLQALIDEKENRTMEIVVTSVSPEQLIGGKTLGLGALGLTQSAVWLSYGLGPVAGGSIFFEPLRSLFMVLTGDMLPVAMMCFIPSYLLYAGLIITVGAVVGSVQEGQQLASLVMLPSLLPLMLVGVIENQPDGAVAIGASLFPLTAPMTLMMRLALTDIPLWQIALSLIILSVSAVLVILLAARLFRWGMLRYGKRFRVRDVFTHVWARRKKQQTAA